MASPLELLGLRLDAGERDVKQAYARRIKHMRPDIDPVGFQRLHEIYRAALQECRLRRAETDGETVLTESLAGRASDIEHGRVADAALPAMSNFPHATYLNTVPQSCFGADPIPDPEMEFAYPTAIAPPLDRGRLHTAPPADHAPARNEAEVLAPIEFNFDAYFSALLQIAEPGDTFALLVWLEGLPALWSLQTKARTGSMTVSALFQQQPPLSPAVFDALLYFFDLDSVQSGLDHLALQQLRVRLQFRWEFAVGDSRRRLNRLMTTRSDLRFDPVLAASMLRRIGRPFRWKINVEEALEPGAIKATAAFIQTLFGRSLRYVPESLDRRQLEFWLNASDSERISSDRIVVGITRCVVMTLLLSACGLLFQDISNYPNLVIPFAMAGLCGSATWGMFLLWQIMRRWQIAPERVSERHRWLRWAFLPILGGAGLALGHLPLKPLSCGFVTLGFLLGVARWRARAGLAPVNVHGWGLPDLLLWIPALMIFNAVTMVRPEFGTGVLMLPWSYDFWRHRAQLRQFLR